MDDAFSRMSIGSSQQTSKANKNRMLVAIDFGTTYSAIAWVRVGANGKATKQSVIQDWPGKANTEDKVPTLLSGDLKKWGFVVKDHEMRYQWFKLEEDPSYTKPELQRNYPKSTIVPESEEKVGELITKFLENLRNHAVEKIKESFGGGEALFRTTLWEFIITVPAMWPEPAQNITRRCAAAAGMATDAPLRIITEPEAAGIFALDDMTRYWPVGVGDSFVICDAGGGTVDLISYSIGQLKPSPILDEAAPGVGKLYGSSFLDRRFDEWLANRFVGYHSWSDAYHESALHHWESEVKREFCGDPNDTYTFRVLGLPDDTSRGIRRGFFEMTLPEVKAIFDPIVTKIVELVNDQINAAKEKQKRDVKAVLLAGGFGSNAYLKAKIEEAVSGRGIKVQKISNNTTAIVRGALIRGLVDNLSLAPNVPRPTIVRSRFAKSHIGTIALDNYSLSKHGKGHRLIPGGVGGGDRIEVMRWLLDKNTVINDGEEIDFKFEFDQPVSDVIDKEDKIDTLSLPIFYCESDNRPKYPDNNEKCKPLVTLPADFNQIPRDLLERRRGSDGQMWYKIPFVIVRTCHLANVTFDFVHLQQNADGTKTRKKYQSVKADWK